jgi:hypothetical protein
MGSFEFVLFNRCENQWSIVQQFIGQKDSNSVEKEPIGAKNSGLTNSIFF